MYAKINPNKWYSGANLGEVLRYSGIRNENLCSDDVLQSAVRAVNEVGDSSSPKKIYKECVLQMNGAECDIDGISVTSKDLAEHLNGCEFALLFAATLGSGVDTLIRRYSEVRMSYAVMLQAAAAALIELYCDIANEELELSYALRGLYLKPRFSPGYGDFSIEHQSELTAHINAYKYAGIAVTGGGQMTPMKSVTAVIGITRTRQRGTTGSCASGKCANCPNMGCEFRRI